MKKVPQSKPKKSPKTISAYKPKKAKTAKIKSILNKTLNGM